MCGILLYSFYGLALISNSINGLTLIYPLTLSILIIFFHKKTKINKKTIVFIFLLCTIVSIGLARSDLGQYSIYKALILIIKAISLILIPSFIPLSDKKNFFTGLSRSLFPILIILSFYSLINFSSFNTNNRLEINQLNPIWISRMVLEFLLISIFIKKNSLKRTLSFAIIILPILYTSGSKGPILAFVCVILLYFLTNFNSGKIFLFVTISIPIFVFLWRQTELLNSEFFISRFLSIIPNGSSINEYESNRLVFIPYLLGNFLLSDWFTILVGKGIGQSSFYMFGYIPNIRFYPHNIVIEILLEFGILGLLLFVMLLFQLFSIKSNFRYFLLYYLINSMFSGDIILNEFIFLYAGFIYSSKMKML